MSDRRNATPVERRSAMKRRVSVFLAAGLTSVLVLIGLFGSRTAQAVINPAGVSNDLVVGIVGQHELGIMSIGGTRVVCIDESGGSFGHVAAPSYLPAPMVMERWDAAYALQRWLGTSNELEAAALYQILGVEMGMNSNPLEVTRAWNGLLTWSSLSALAGVRASMLDEIARNAGPYDDPDLRLVISDGIGRAGAVDGVGLLSAAGFWQPGFTAVLTLFNEDDPSAPSPAVFDANGSETLTVTTVVGLINGLAWHAVGNGPLKVRVDIAGVPQFINLYPQPAAGQQRTVANAAPGTLTFRDPNNVPARNSFVPSVATTVASALSMPGLEVADRWVASGGEPDSTQSGVAELFGPFAVQPTASTPPGASVGSVPVTVSYDASGEASGITPSITLADDAAVGFYTWRISLDASGDNEAVVSEFGVVEETVLVADPRIGTQVSSQQALPGDTISDTATVSGLVDRLPDGTEVSATVEGTLVSAAALIGQDGNPTCVGVDWSQATHVLDVPSMPVTADGAIPDLGVFTVPEDSPRVCYSYGETLRLTPSDGTPPLVVSHDPGAVEQTSLIWNPGARIRSGVPGSAGGVGWPGLWMAAGVAVLGGLAVWRGPKAVRLFRSSL
jgi:hypothetical protein